jgi:hypothetical protein
VTPCSILGGYLRSGEYAASIFKIYVWSISTLKMEQHVPLAWLHYVTTQENTIRTIPPRKPQSIHIIVVPWKTRGMQLVQKRSRINTNMAAFAWNAFLVFFLSRYNVVHLKCSANIFLTSWYFIIVLYHKAGFITVSFWQINKTPST